MIDSALAQVSRAGTLAELDEIRVQWLGKRGQLTEQLKALGTLSAAERPAAGATINAAKVQLQAAIEAQLTYPAVRQLFKSEDFKEGPRAFAQRRAPVWKNA